MNGNLWTPAQDAEMLRLCGLGWTATAIGPILGKTKSAINCRRKRLGLAEPAEQRAERRAANSLREKIRVGAIDFRNPGDSVGMSPRPPRHFVLDDTSRTDGKTIEQSTRGCRWPIGGEGADTLFCCRAKARGSYCDDHAKRAYTGGQVTPEAARDLARLFRRAA
jgi:GcrA cell cycle regulator